MEGGGAYRVFLKGGIQLSKILHRDFGQQLLCLANLLSAQRERAHVEGVHELYRA